jgi:thiol:disulfide interchange protein DsbA
VKLSRRDFHHFVFAGLAGAAWPAFAAPLLIGRDYAPIDPPQPGEVPGKIEVLEFFSYGCPHCKDFHPLVMAWAPKLPPDAAFRRVPVSFNRAAWANLAKLHYALQVSGDLARLEEAVFHAIHVERVSLFTPSAILSWAKRQGVDEKRFAAAYESFGVASQVARGDQLVNSHKVEEVPLLTVAGRYAVTGPADGGSAGRLATADALIARARGGG